MSAPDTNVETQERKHSPSLFGIRAAMIWGGLMIVGLVVFNIANAGDGEAVSNAEASGPVGTTVATDTYAPGTNSSSTPVDPAIAD
ncbi:hypothetical protein KDD17_08535 [Sulfitobacter albidus]|uniref:Uncharacterized protein n=1 Tax=Sulfitobacter albidus TaxID=2829501 RepID=A0A975JB29_9RHOB|nr:hypothetical protein [Sulfitobacter albidus]QUJ75087.1 hypothetical protein KDD17_08535 [Sulfitobacter albidus]